MCNMLFENNQLDKRVYREELKDYLPKKMIDIHTHLWRKSDVGVIPVTPNAPVRWPSLVADENTIEDLQETYKIMFPNALTHSLGSTQKRVYLCIVENLKKLSIFFIINFSSFT